MMSVQVRIQDGELAPYTQGEYVSGCGAKIVFDGIVRPSENGEAIEGLEYQAYRPMAEEQLEIIGRELLEEFGLVAIDIEHSVGWVPNLACSFRLVIDSKHRKEGLEAMGMFIDRLKQDVPIWKQAK